MRARSAGTWRRRTVRGECWYMAAPSSAARAARARRLGGRGFALRAHAALSGVARAALSGGARAALPGGARAAEAGGAQRRARRVRRTPRARAAPGSARVLCARAASPGARWNRGAASASASARRAASAPRAGRSARPPPMRTRRMMPPGAGARRSRAPPCLAALAPSWPAPSNVARAAPGALSSCASCARAASPSVGARRFRKS